MGIQEAGDTSSCLSLQTLLRQGVKMKSVDEASQQLIDKLSHDENANTLKEQSASVAVAVVQPTTKPPKPKSTKVIAEPVAEPEGEPEPEIKLGSKRSRTSLVWNDFDTILVDKKVKAVCHHCKKQLGGASKDGTKHLHEHLKRCQRKKSHDVKQGILKMGNENGGKAVLGGGAAFDQDECRLKLSKLIVMDELPFLITDFPAFRDYSSTLQPLFKMPGRTTIRSDIMKLFEFEK